MDQPRLLFNKSQKFLRSASVLLELEDYDSAASRAYFAMFYAAQALLIHRRMNGASQQGIRSAFSSAFVESGELPEHAADVLNHGQRLQEMADYAHQFSVSPQDAEELLQEAEAFVNTLEGMTARETYTKR